jgi:hypothetical protein
MIGLSEAWEEILRFILGAAEVIGGVALLLGLLLMFRAKISKRPPDSN